MEKYKDFWSVLFGTGARGFFFGYVVLSIISAAGIILVMASQKYKSNPESPDIWSWKYFFLNNAGNFGASLFVLPLFIRVLVEFIAEPKWMLLASIGVGFGFYRLAKIANDAGILTTNKLSKKLAEKLNNDPPDTKQ